MNTEKFMVSKRKIGICLIVIAIVTIGVVATILSSYDNPDYFWGYFVVGLSVVFACLAVGLYMLSKHFENTNAKLSKFLWWFGVYVLVCIVGLIVYAICNATGVINL